MVAAILLLAAFATLSVRIAWTTSATFDEPGLIVAGYTYHRSPGPEICTTNLRLLPLWLAAPLRVLHPALPDEIGREPRLIVSGDLDLGRAFLADPRNHGTTLLRASRCANLLLGVALGALLFGWSRRLHGDTGGLITLTLYCLNPVIIANSALATTDLGMALLFVVAAAALWGLLHRVSPGRVAGGGLALGALATAKLSWFLILPVTLVLLALRLRSPEPLEVRWGRRALAPRRWLAWWGGAALVVALIAYGTVWCVYGFRYSPGVPLPPAAWPAGDPPTLVARLIATLREARLLPEAYLFDLQTFATTGSGRRAFLAGDYALDGWWYFFPVVWFLKSPLSFLGALGLALAAPLFARGAGAPDTARAGKSDMLPLLVLGALYLAVAMASPLNIGIRHLLPVYPLLFVFAGRAGAWRGGPRGLRLAGLALLLGGAAAEAALVHPEYLAYVNAFGGGEKRGYRVLADSSYDWGQDLPAFEQWLQSRPATAAKVNVYFSYFGNSDLARFKDRVVLLPQYVELRPATVYGLGPGTYVISATMLQTLFGPLMGPWRPAFETRYRDSEREMRRLEEALARGGQAAFDALVAQEGMPAWQERILWHDHLRFARLCAWLRQREPSQRITRTLLAYELTGEDLRAALAGPPAELRDNYRVKGERP